MIAGEARAHAGEPAGCAGHLARARQLGKQPFQRPHRRAGRLQQAVARIVEHHEAELAFVFVAERAGFLNVGLACRLRAGADHRAIERLLQGEARVGRHVGGDHAGQQARLLGEHGIEQLLDLVACVAVADVRDCAQRHGEQAEHEQQGAAADRAHQALSTR